MSDKNVMRVVYESNVDVGKQYRSGWRHKYFLNDHELTGVVDFKHEVGVEDIMSVTLKILVAGLEIERVDIQNDAGWTSEVKVKETRVQGVLL